MRKLLTILLVLACAFADAQQLPVYSGFHTNKYLLNPAVGGSQKFIDLRLQHRSQWLGMQHNPTTHILSGHSSIDKTSMGVGATLHSDQTGVEGNLGLSLSYAYHIPLGEYVNCALGLSGHFNQYRLVPGRMNLAHTDDPLLAGGSNNKFAPNASGGLYIYDTYKWYAGLSALNVLKQNIVFNQGATSPTTPHLYAMGGYSFIVAKSHLIQPSFFASMISGNPAMVDLRITYDYLEIFQVHTGYRLNDAAIVGFGVYPIPNLGLSYYYDLGLSGLRTAHSGSHEIQLRYIHYYKPIYQKDRRRYKWIDIREAEKAKKKSEGENKD